MPLTPTYALTPHEGRIRKRDHLVVRDSGVVPVAGVRRRFAPHQLRHAHAIEMAHEGIPLPIIQRQLGHAHLGITSIYLQGIDTREIVDTVHDRRPPVIPASAGLRS